MKKIFLLSLLILVSPVFSCSIFYYVDSITGHIYVGNNEDYWYNVKAYIQLEPRDEKELARLWYGWDDFAQGGINEAGLFFDGAVTPNQPTVLGYNKPKKGNLGDELLATCKNVEEVIWLLEEKKIAILNAHILVGDSTGNAAVIEWVNGSRVITPIQQGRLVMTNFLLADTTQGNYPCSRFSSINHYFDKLNSSEDSLTFLSVSNALGGAAQPVFKDEKGKEGGTLYSSFIDITSMKFVMVYKLDNTRIIQFDLKNEFTLTKKKKIFLKKI